MTVPLFGFAAGEPGALEAHIRQLDKALDTSRFQIQQTENIIRSKTPTGPELDSTYKGYVRVFWSPSQICTPSLAFEGNAAASAGQLAVTASQTHLCCVVTTLNHMLLLVYVNSVFTIA